MHCRGCCRNLYLTVINFWIWKYQLTLFNHISPLHVSRLIISHELCALSRISALSRHIMTPSLEGCWVDNTGQNFRVLFFTMARVQRQCSVYSSNETNSRNFDRIYLKFGGQTPEIYCSFWRRSGDATAPAFQTSKNASRFVRQLVRGLSIGNLGLANLKWNCR